MTALPASTLGPEATQKKRGEGNRGDGEENWGAPTLGAPGGAHAACLSGHL